MRLSSLASSGILASAFVFAGATRAMAQQEALPICNNGGPYSFECTGQQTMVQLDGTGSIDPDGTPVTFLWFEECPYGFFLDPTSPTPTFVVDMTGVCSRTCIVEIRVTSGGQEVRCNTSVVVTDTQAPVITCPPDVTEIYTTGVPGGQTSPTLTGYATASDCDPNVVITYSDVVVPGTHPGDPESVTTRTWIATDQCGFSSSCQQLITLLSPGNGGQTYYLDAVQGQCPNLIDVNAESGLFTGIIFARAGFAAADINQSSMVLCRQDNVGGTITRMSKVVKDVGRPRIGNPCDCDGLKDSLPDITVTMSLPAVIQTLGLDQESTGASVKFALYFKTNDGKWHTTLDCVTIDRQ